MNTANAPFDVRSSSGLSTQFDCESSSTIEPATSQSNLFDATLKSNAGSRITSNLRSMFFIEYSTIFLRKHDDLHNVKKIVLNQFLIFFSYFVLIASPTPLHRQQEKVITSKRTRKPVSTPTHDSTHAKTSERNSNVACAAGNLKCCDIQFTRPAHFKRHVSRHHSEHGQNNRIACPDCSKSFLHKENLAQHQKIHKKKLKQKHKKITIKKCQKLICENCGKKFTRKSSLIRHFLNTNCKKK